MMWTSHDTVGFVFLAGFCVHFGFSFEGKSRSFFIYSPHTPEILERLSGFSLPCVVRGPGAVQKVRSCLLLIRCCGNSSRQLHDCEEEAMVGIKGRMEEEGR